MPAVTGGAGTLGSIGVDASDSGVRPRRRIELRLAVFIARDALERLGGERDALAEAKMNNKMRIYRYTPKGAHS